MRSIVILFEDQLSLENPVFKTANPRHDVAVLVDSAECTDKTARNKLFRSRALDAFADDLRRMGWRSDIISVDRREGRGALGRSLKWCAQDADIHHLIAAEPGDASMRTSLERLAPRFRKTVRILNDPRFICTRQEFSDIRDAAGSTAGFYQSLRRREDLLMDGDQPEGGRWRYIDGDSPAGLRPRKEEFAFERPAPTAFQAKRDLERFIEFVLPRLNACEHLDAAQPNAFPCPDVGAMMDAGVLSPLIVCHRIERAYREGKVSLFAAEHAIYSIVGLREFRRGLMRLGEIPADFDPSPDERAAFRAAHERREAGLATQRRLYALSQQQSDNSAKWPTTGSATKRRSIIQRASAIAAAKAKNIVLAAFGSNGSRPSKPFQGRTMQRL